MTQVDVKTDPGLDPAERETTIRWAADEDTAVVHSEMPAVARWLIRNPKADVKVLRRHDGAIVAVSARLSVGAIKLSGTPRKSTTASSVTGKLPEGET